MKELRDIVNAVAIFLVFLVCWAFLRPGYVTGSPNAPRFIRMQVDGRDHGGPETLSLAVPFGLVGGTLRLAATGRLERELDREFPHHVEADELREAVKELREKPDAVIEKNEDDRHHVTYRREGSFFRVDVKEDREGTDSDESVTLRVPFSLVEALADSDRDLDVDAVLSELEKAPKGDLVDVRDGNARVRVWIE